jgi:biopolymer transport protein ExbD
MSLQIQCPQCGARRRVNQRLQGRRMRCPSCDATIAVPTAEEVERARQERARRRAAVLVPALEDEGDALIPLGDEATTPAHPPVLQDAAPPPDWDEPEVLPLGRGEKRPETDVDMTPMVDVTFLLLIFFMVTAAFSLQKSIEMPRQQSDDPSLVETEEDDELDQVTVQIDQYNSFLVIAADWEREVPGKQNLINALREAFGSGGSGPRRLVIECHERAILQTLVDAMDAGTAVGFAELQVTDVEDFD